MLLKEGDIVWVARDKFKYRLERATLDLKSVRDWLVGEMRHLTVAEAFEMAGMLDLGVLGFENYVGDWHSEKGRLVGTSWVATRCAPPRIDLSRTPVSDCWGALPPVVREAVEKKLEDQ